MVTLITDKLKNQSLEDLPGNGSEMSAIRPRVNPGRAGHISDCPLAHRLRRDGRQIFGHSRTRSYPSQRPRRSYCRNCSGADSSAEYSATLPPANKKLCPSLSLPGDESSDGYSAWVPRPSSVWQPVEIVGEKPRSVSCPDEKFQLAESLWVNNDVDSISTPPASPTPRPASADAALEEKRLHAKTQGVASIPLGDHTRKSRDLNFNWNASLPGLHRSRSQPCFDRRRTGVKRRIEDDFDARRPALDLAKMEETSYYRCQDRKKGLRIPRYMNKRCSRGSTSYFTEPENFTLKPIASSPLDAQDSSIMITPISSPTKQLDCENEVAPSRERKIKLVNTEKGSLNRLNQKAQDEGVFHLDYDSDLDLNSIEEDDLF